MDTHIGAHIAVRTEGQPTHITSVNTFLLVLKELPVRVKMFFAHVFELFCFVLFVFVSLPFPLTQECLVSPGKGTTHCNFRFPLQLTIPSRRKIVLFSLQWPSLVMTSSSANFRSISVTANAVARACLWLWTHIERQHIPHRIKPYTRSGSKHRKNGTEMSGCVGNGGRLCCFIFPTILCVPL